MCTNNVKVPKNLDIVMECSEIADESQEKQALLMEKSVQEKHTNHNQSASPITTLPPTIKQEDVICHDNSNHSQSAYMEFSESNDMSNSKQRKRTLQQSRVERSRLSLITFLNNITAPTHSDTSSSGKNLRSQSISSPPQIQPQHERKQNKTHKQNKSIGSDKTIENHQVNSDTTQEPLLTGDCHICDIVSETIKDTETELTASHNPVPADKLSIKSGVSMAASFNSIPSESIFSAGSAQSNISGSKIQKHRECPICCIRQQAVNFHRLKCCPHLTCKSCLVKYLNTEIMESRTNITCPECPAQLHAIDIYSLLSNQPGLIERFEQFALRRALSIDPDTRWCPAPDCFYAVIAHSCAACPKLRCERCDTMFCYHCKNYWHPNQTCDQARAKSIFTTPIIQTARHFSSDPNNDVMKACPRCGALIMKMNDGSCNHMQCALCNAEFCWLCLKQINELHYLSPTGCTFWGKKPWTRKKKLLWQIGTLIGAPLGIALIAGLAVPGIICGVPIFVGRKTYQRFSNLTRTKRQLVTGLSVFGSLIVSPVLAVMTVGVGVPIMLAYVYGVVPLSLCRNGACGGFNSNDTGGDDDEVAYGEDILVINAHNNGSHPPEERSLKQSSHQRKQSSASYGLSSLNDKPTELPNTENASIQAIAGSQYNYDNRSVHTVWSSGQYVSHVSAMESAQEVTSYNNDDAENSSTMACCSASIVAQASERRSLTGSSGSFKTRPRSSISNSRGNSEEPGKITGKSLRKTSRANTDAIKGSILENPVRKMKDIPQNKTLIGPSHIIQNTGISVESGHSTKDKKRFSFRSFIRHPVDTILSKRKEGDE